MMSRDPSAATVAAVACSSMPSSGSVMPISSLCNAATFSQIQSVAINLCLSISITFTINGVPTLTECASIMRTSAIKSLCSVRGCWM